jgi:hypothetical protein
MLTPIIPGSLYKHYKTLYVVIGRKNMKLWSVLTIRVPGEGLDSTYALEDMLQYEIENLINQAKWNTDFTKQLCNVA